MLARCSTSYYDLNRGHPSRSWWKALEAADPELPQSDPVLIGPNLYQRTVGDLVSGFMSYSRTQLSVYPIVQRNVIQPQWPQNLVRHFHHNWDLYDACKLHAPDFLRSIIGQGEPKPRVMMTDFFSPLRWTQIEKMVLLHAFGCSLLLFGVIQWVQPANKSVMAANGLEADFMRRQQQGPPN